MAAEAPMIDYTPLSSTKQNRIMIWRDEVVASANADPASDSFSLAPSSSNASASTGNSSSSSTAAASTGNHKDALLSRRSRLWRRLSKHLRVTSLSTGPSPLDLELKAREEVRTSMYRESWAAEEAAAAAKAQQEAAANEDQGGVMGLLGERQERLERAERLLNKGLVMQPVC
ncbi:hypothetical protein LIA77_02713 [Sarocladium implicatum]|nr:hypothetical protein LIA77_02713 [Sarocladium implicatum]